jgi:hypothetical protein
VLLAVRVSPLLAVAGLVPKIAETPLGRPDAVSVTLPLNPFKAVTSIVFVPLVPRPIDTVGKEAESENPGEVEAVPTNVVMLCAGSE